MMGGYAPKPHQNDRSSKPCWATGTQMGFSQYKLFLRLLPWVKMSGIFLFFCWFLKLHERYPLSSHPEKCKQEHVFACNSTEFSNTEVPPRHQPRLPPNPSREPLLCLSSPYYVCPWVMTPISAEWEDTQDHPSDWQGLDEVVFRAQAQLRPHSEHTRSLRHFPFSNSLKLKRTRWTWIQVLPLNWLCDPD